MPSFSDTALATWLIVALATAGVIVRPFRVPEAAWAVSGACLLVIAGLLPWRDAVRGVARGTDVYLFLTGMMLLAELARQEGLFDWLAACAASLAKGSATRLFTLVYGVGTIVTIFLSNDATAVVLTPAVAAAMRAVQAENPLPYLLICAFIANAASFVLPISNPANLVIYGSHMPPLLQWLPRYALPSLLAVAATYAALRLTQARALRQPLLQDVEIPVLSTGGKTAAAGICVTAVVLMAASACDRTLGLPTFLAGLTTSVVVLGRTRAAPWPIVRGVSWGVLPLVGGLFVLVEALGRTGFIGVIASLLHRASLLRGAPLLQGASLLHGAAGHGWPWAAWGAGAVLALSCNVMNNLPAGLIAGTAVQAAHSSPGMTAAILVGVDLGPNLSVTGSLATILWLAALRREGHGVQALAFLKIGAVVMPPALILALLAVAAPDMW